MRQIKFRAWDGKKMIMPKDKAYYQNYISLCGNIIQKSSERMDCFGGGDRWSRQENLILMQYTGLTDKNGVEIYDKDYIRLFGDLVIVSWSDSNACFNTQKILPPYNIERLGQYSAPAFEVVGNSLQNPELLEQSK